MYCLYLIVLCFSFVGIFHLYSKQTRKILILLWFCLFAFIGTFAYFSDDYEPYEELTELVYISPMSHTHIEPLWMWLIGLFNGNVDSFRFVSFLFLSTLLAVIAKYAKTSLLYFLFFYTLLCMSAHICWIRQPMAYGIFLLGLLFLGKNKFLFVSFIILSFFIHKSAILLIALLPFLLFPLNRKTFLIYILLAFPFALILFHSAVLFTQDSLGIPLDHYLSADGEYADRNVLFSIIAGLSTIAQLLIIAKIILLFKEHPDVYSLVRCLFGIAFISFLLIVSPMENNVIYKRLLSFGNLLIAIICGIKVRNHFLEKKYLSLIILIIITIGLREISMIGNNYTYIGKLLRVPHLF